MEPRVGKVNAAACGQGTDHIPINLVSPAARAAESIGAANKVASPHLKELVSEPYKSGNKIMQNQQVLIGCARH